MRTIHTLPTALACCVLAFGCGTEPAAEASIDGSAGDDDAGAVGADVSGGDDAGGSVADVTPSTDAAPRPDAPVVVDADPPPDASDDLREACEASCALRASDGPGAGFCDFRESPECVDFCTSSVADQSIEVQEALQFCIETDPLCFQTPLQCVLSRLYPEPFEHTTTLVGSGFDAWPTAPVVAAMERGGAPGTFVFGDALVGEDGTFEIEITQTLGVGAAHNVYFFVDVDMDGDCDPTPDLADVGRIELYNWPFDEIRIPDWRVEVSPRADRPSDFVCGLLNDAMGP